jgi:hypothetical protein
MRAAATMPTVPPDPRTVLNARIHHFKKQTQKLNLEFLEASADLERAKEAVRESRAKPAAAGAAQSAGTTDTETRPPLAELAKVPVPSDPPNTAVAESPLVVTVRPFAEGVGYALTGQGASLWFDNEAHAIKYAQEVFPHCEIIVVHRDGTVNHHYEASSA